MGARFAGTEALGGRGGALTGPGFEACPEVAGFVRGGARLLVVGAGGLGCELLKDLALLGFGHLEVVDMDTIDETNLNRQFLFRLEDVGKPKAEVAAARVSERVPSCRVIPHYCRLEDKPPEFYRQFHVVVLGLDSVEARSWVNDLCCSFLEYDANGEPDRATILPMVDGGTEGFKGHARVIIPGVTPCFQCTAWLFPPQQRFPLCTLAETPRSAAHCVEYARIVLWDREGPGQSGTEFDGDDPEHVSWVFSKATQRAQAFGIEGVTYSHTQGVVKNIVPAIASTNAIVSAVCATETLKLITTCSPGLNNYFMYMGGEGLYTHTVEYERDSGCLSCSAGLPCTVEPGTSLHDLIGRLMRDERLGGKLQGPSLFFGAKPLFAHGPLEAITAANLSKTMEALVGLGEGVLSLNDKGLKAPVRIRLTVASAA